MGPTSSNIRSLTQDCAIVLFKLHLRVRSAVVIAEANVYALIPARMPVIWYYLFHLMEGCTLMLVT